MLIFDRGFPLGYQQHVQQAVEAILDKLDSPPGGVKLPPDLRGGLQTVLDGTKPFPHTISSRGVMLAFDDMGSTGPFAYTGGSCIWLCQRTFEAGQARLNAVLLHELVHVMCGWELDGEVFENLLFPYKSATEEGATLPDVGDKKAFARRNWKGRWVRVVRRDGEVIVENLWGEAILSPGSGLADAFMRELARSQGIPEA
jgi:hypothetical protein